MSATVVAEVVRVLAARHVPIPKRFAEELGIERGDHIQWILENGRQDGEKVLILRTFRKAV